jgi:subtilisin
VAAGGTAAASPPEARIVGTASRRAERAAKNRADRVDTVLHFEHLGKAVVGRFSDEAAENLSRRDDVRYVEHNGTMRKFAETLPWGVGRVDADAVHSDGGTGGGATVAVLDTDIDDDHPGLAANVVGGKAFETGWGAESRGCRYGAKGYNGNDCNHTWSDDDNHGSHVAGTVDAVDNTEGVIGVATGADLLAGKVLIGCGSGTYSAIASGVKWATDQGADVINMSLDGSSGSSTLRDACRYAYDNNVVTVAAAGNDGPCTDRVGYPTAYDTVLAVSATTPSDTLAGYSSTGPEVEITAPGGANDGDDSTSVLSTIPSESEDTDGDGYAYFVGTSMLSPHVAGAAALVKAETSLTDNQQIIDRLKSSAKDIGLASHESGAGLLDAEAAVGSSSGGKSAPAVDGLSASEVETSDSDAEFDVA